MSKRVFAIGDIHGEVEALENLITSLNAKPEDEFIFLGDYIDRGKSSKQVIDFLINLSKKHDCTFVRGNHEEFLLKSLIEDDKNFHDFWCRHGGDQALKSYGVETVAELRIKMPDDHLAFYLNTVSAHEIDTHIFSHANWECHKPLKDQDTAHLRYHFMDVARPVSTFKKQVVVGHSALMTGKPAHKGNFLCIDTVQYGWLTAYDVTNGGFYQASKENKTRYVEKSDLYSEARHVPPQYWRRLPKV